MKTILHIIDSLGTGGAERVVVNNINLFKQYNHILCVLNNTLELATEIENDVPIEVLNLKSKFHIFCVIRKLRKVIRNHKPDIIHTHLLWSSWIARLAKPSNIPLVASVHSILSKGAFQKNWHSKIIEQSTAKKVSAFITVSNSVKKDYLSHIKYIGPVETIYNFNNLSGITKSRALYLSGHTFKIIVVGNIIPVKNHIFLVNALAKLPEYYLNKIHIDVWGHGQLIEDYKYKIEKLKLPIFFASTSSEQLRHLYGEYHAFCMPSLYEGLGMAVLEAIDAELPLILSDIDVFRELAQDKALFFEVTKIEHFCELIKSIINGEIDLNKYKERTKCLAKYLGTKQSYITQHYRLYQSLLTQ